MGLEKVWLFATSGVHEDAAMGDRVIAGFRRAEAECAGAGEGVGGERCAIEEERLEFLIGGGGDGGGCRGHVEDGGVSG